MRLRNCKDLKELEELRKAMQEAKEAVIFAEKRED
jgi:Xaa-Pro aminopeptidase